MSSPHPDDERLSAHLDGEAGGEDAHLEGCAQCRARLSELRSVADRVAELPSPPSPTDRERGVAAALGAAAVTSRATVPLPRSRRWAMPVGMAAAVVAVALVAGLVVATVGRDAPSSDRAALESTPPPRPAASDRAAAHGGDLGEQSDENALRHLVEAGLAGRAAAFAGDAPGNDDAAGAPAGQTAPTAGTASRGATPAAAPPADADPPCSGSARAGLGQLGLGPLVYTASLRWKGEPAVVLVYEARPGPARPGRLGHQVVVMDQATCRLLVAQRL